MPFSIRLDSRSKSRIARLASLTGRTRADVVREAVERYEIETEDRTTSSTSNAAERLRPWIGVASGGDPRLSEQTGAGFRRLLQEKRRARRAR